MDGRMKWYSRTFLGVADARRHGVASGSPAGRQRHERRAGSASWPRSDTARKPRSSALIVLHGREVGGVHFRLSSPVLDALAPADAVDALDCDQVAVDHIDHPVAADPQPVIVATVESLGRVRVVGKAGYGSADGAHPILVRHEAAC